MRMCLRIFCVNSLENIHQESSRECSHEFPQELHCDTHHSAWQILCNNAFMWRSAWTSLWTFRWTFTMNVPGKILSELSRHVHRDVHCVYTVYSSGLLGEYTMNTPRHFQDDQWEYQYFPHGTISYYDNQ